MRAVGVTAATRLVPDGLSPVPEELSHTGLTGLGVVAGPELSGLRRRRDRKLFARSTTLLLAAAQAWEEPPGPVGLFMAVGREPPEPQTEEALLAAQRDGLLDPERLATRGVPAYPPLASLRTLPNLALAHVAIQRGFHGPAESWAGEEAAGLVALCQAYWSVAEGRVDVAWVGAADSRVAPALARDLVRRGLAGPGRSPGEGAALLRLSPVEDGPVLATLQQVGRGFGEASTWRSPEEANTGAMGAAAGLGWLVTRMGQGPGTLRVREASGVVAWCSWT